MFRNFTIALFCTVLCLAAESQDLDTADVVARCAEALGGEDNWQAVTGLEIAGTETSISQAQPFLLRKMRPDLYRLDGNEGARSITIVHDGETAWWKREFLLASRGDWELLAPDSYSRAFRADAQFAMPCLQHHEEGYDVAFTGESELDGEPFLRLEVTLEGGSVESWYLDRESFRPVARVSMGVYWWLPTEQRTFFSDYREVSGIFLPYLTEIEFGNLYRTFEVERVEVNPELDSKGVFSLPLPRGMQDLQQLAGHWMVAVKSRESAEFPWRESEATSVISSQFDGHLLEENLSYVGPASYPLSVKRLFSYDRFQNIFRIAVFDNFTSHLNVLEGAFEDGALVLSNLSTGSPWSVYGKTFHTRERLHDLSPDSFRVSRETSVDAGATWFVEEELSYSRAGDSPSPSDSP